MTTPAWAPGTLYLPGDLVRPRSSAAITQDAPLNASFETGLTDWSQTTEGGAATFTIKMDQHFDGAQSAYFIGGAGTFQGTDGQLGVLINDNHVDVVPGQNISATGRFTAGGGSNTFNTAGVRIYWYDASDTFLSYSVGPTVNPGKPPRKGPPGTTNGGFLQPGAWLEITCTATAPAGAAKAAFAFVATGNGTGLGVWLDAGSWDYSFSDTGATPEGLVFKAVQSAPGFSATTEPTWPLTNGATVVDNYVIWEATEGSRIVWTASPILVSGATEPTFPTTSPATVADNTISWLAMPWTVDDSRAPHSSIVAIATSKVFAGDDDIAAFSATVNPLDWSTTDDAGYLPFGLQTYGSQPITAFGLYRGNLLIFNAQGFQMWQVGEDPADHALLDAVPVGTIYPRAGVPIANDFVFLTDQGIRSISIAAASTNLEAGDFGKAIDPLVNPKVQAITQPHSVGDVPNLLVGEQLGSNTAEDYIETVGTLLYRLKFNEASGTSPIADGVNGPPHSSATSGAGVTVGATVAGEFDDVQLGLTLPGGAISNVVMSAATNPFTSVDHTPAGSTGAIFFGLKASANGTIFRVKETAGQTSMAAYIGFNTPGKFLFAMTTAGGQATYREFNTNTLTDNAWHFLAVVQRGTGWKLFVDGVEDTNFTDYDYSGPGVNAWADYLGSDYTLYTTEFFSISGITTLAGQVDTVSFVEGAVSDAQISAIQTRRTGGGGSTKFGYSASEFGTQSPPALTGTGRSPVAAYFDGDFVLKFSTAGYGHSTKTGLFTTIYVQTGNGILALASADSTFDDSDPDFDVWTWADTAGWGDTDVGSQYTIKFDGAITPQYTVPGEQPIGLFVPALGQYWLVCGDEAFVLTSNGVGKDSQSWSRYTFPSEITDWTILNGELYLRSGDLVWRVDDEAAYDDQEEDSAIGGTNANIEGYVAWPYLDMGRAGVTKSLAAFDLVITGEVNVQFGYDQTNDAYVTPAYIVTGDTLPGEPIPMPITAPTIQMRLTFTPGQHWEWEMSILYVDDNSAFSV